MNGTILEVPSKKMKTKMNGDQLLNASPNVAAMTSENEVTLKTFYKEQNHIRLQPENDTMAPIISAKSGPMNVAVKYSGIMKAKSAIIVNGIKPFNAFVP